MAVVKEVTGASHVFSSNHIRRQSGHVRGEAVQGGVLDKLFGFARGPSLLVHNDFTESYGEAIIKSVVTGVPHTQGYGSVEPMRRDPSVTEALLRSSRIMVVNTWRPYNDEALRRFPLAVADRRSVPRTTLRPALIGPPNRGIETYNYVEEDPAHEWYYFPEMTRDELLLIKTFDSAEDPFCPTLHTAFDDPATPPDAPPRRSVEVRVLCLIPQQTATMAEAAGSAKL